MEEEELPVVIDNGSATMKIGFAGDDVPRASFQSIVGRWKYGPSLVGMNRPDFLIGEEAIAKRGLLIIRYPIEHGICVNWDDMEKLWHHAFYDQLKCAIEEHPVLMTENIFNSVNNREKMTQIMFETFNTPSFYAMTQSILSLFACGRINGVVLQSGDGVTNAVTCYEGHTLKHSLSGANFGGRDLTDHMMKLLTDSGHQFTRYYKTNFVKDIKENLGYIAIDYDAEMQKFNRNSLEIEQKYELPDGDVINVGSERFECCEALFNPSLIGKKCDGIDAMICESIKKSQIEDIDKLYSNIVIAGGSTMFKGIDKRLSKELQRLTVEEMNIKIIAPDTRQYSAWIGGSVVSCLPEYRSLFMTKEDYDEIGPSIIHRQCF